MNNLKWAAGGAIVAALGLAFLQFGTTGDGFPDGGIKGEGPRLIAVAGQTESLYHMPEESDPHEGTWLQWPHHHQYGVAYRNSLDPTWVAMTRALVGSEKVHIIAYDEAEKNRIITLLKKANVPLDQVDFSLYETDDVWVRDNGPIFVRDQRGQLVLQDWGFNGWGRKVDSQSGRPIEYKQCNVIPSRIAADRNLPLVDLNAVMINEGGSVELDGHGTLMACRSSVLNENRNPGMTQAAAEGIFRKYLGVRNFVWLEGRAGLDLTDQHVDGFARFGNTSTIVTMSENDLLEFDVRGNDIKTLYSARNAEGGYYLRVIVPLTHNTVKKPNGVDLGYKGSYINYYIANKVVLVPNYHDPNDEKANRIIQQLYPSRTVVGIDVRNLYENGGMIHCVTQQQPISLGLTAQRRDISAE